MQIILSHSWIFSAAPFHNKGLFTILTVTSGVKPEIPDLKGGKQLRCDSCKNKKCTRG